MISDEYYYKLKLKPLKLIIIMVANAVLSNISVQWPCFIDG